MAARRRSWSASSTPSLVKSAETAASSSDQKVGTAWPVMSGLSFQVVRFSSPGGISGAGFAERLVNSSSACARSALWGSVRPSCSAKSRARCCRSLSDTAPNSKALGFDSSSWFVFHDETLWLVELSARSDYRSNLSMGVHRPLNRDGSCCCFAFKTLLD